MGKLRVGIDIDEVLRAKWLQFDRFYAQEFGEDDIEDEPSYVYDLFKGYPWKDTVEVIKEMREPDETPDDINPIDYQVDDNGDAPADFLLFKKEEEVTITAKEMYNRFMYEDYLFELNAAAPIMYKGMDLHVNNFLQKYEKNVDFCVMSIENRFSIPPTLFFLSKMSCRFKEYIFVDKAIDMWKNVDILITTDPVLIKLGAPWGKKLIKLKRPYNVNIKGSSMEALQIADLIESEDFQKIVKYKNNKKKI